MLQHFYSHQVAAKRLMSYAMQTAEIKQQQPPGNCQVQLHCITKKEKIVSTKLPDQMAARLSCLSGGCH